MKMNSIQKKERLKTSLARFFSLVSIALFSCFSANATDYFFADSYSGTQSTPPNASAGSGLILGTYDDVTNIISYSIVFSGLGSNTTNGHFHGPGAPGVSAPVIVPYPGFPLGVTSGLYTHTDVLTAAQETELLNGLVYSNIHTVNYPSGEIRAQINPVALNSAMYPFVAVYSGANEVPPNNSPGIGLIGGAFNSTTNFMIYKLYFADLSGGSTGAHFHAPASPGATAPIIIPFVGFPTGVTSGAYTNVAALNNVQKQWLMDGLFYANIHTSAIPSGEIRAQIILGPRADCNTPTFLNDKTIVLDASQCANDGNISIIPLIGTSPYMYSIDGGATYVAGPDAGYTFMGLAPGMYKLRLKGADGCESDVVTREVKKFYPCSQCTPPTFINDKTIVLDASCKGGDGNITIVPLSGTAPFQYSLDGGATYVAGPNTGYTFMNLAAGIYQLRLKDAGGCQSAVVTREVKANAFGPCIVQAINPRLKSSAIDAVAQLRTYPNPSHGQFQVQLQGFGAGKVQVQILDIRGSVLQNKVVNAQESNVLDINLQGKAKGLYLVRVISNKGTQIQKVQVQ